MRSREFKARAEERRESHSASGSMHPDQPDPLSPETFQVLRDMLHLRTGINLAVHKIPMVQSRLNKRLRHLGLRRYEDYLEHLKGGEDREEWTFFVNALTTNLTRFFREEHHFRRLVAWYQARPDATKIRIWSAGCSTGEEPYTLAMTLRAAFPDSDIRIFASDLDSNVLKTAAEGVYPRDRVDGLDLDWLRYGFERGRGSMEGKVRIRPAFRDLVEFRQFNLLGDWPAGMAFDAVFCRNVMIYFDKPSQRRLLASFHRVLPPGGLLVIGHSEALLDGGLGFRSLGETIYERGELPS